VTFAERRARHRRALFARAAVRYIHAVVVLNKNDFDAIRDRARLARRAWADVELHHQELKVPA
jgi:hypothetical protein